MNSDPDDCLTRLPIPNLNDTLNKYYETIEPLQDVKQNEIFKKNLFSDDNLQVLTILDNALREYDKLLESENPKSSYIEQFWYDAYLLYDESLVMNINPFFQLADDPTINNKTFYDNISNGSINYIYGEYTLQIKRTTKLVNSILKFIREIRHNKLKKDYIIKRDKNGNRVNVNLSMDQYDKLFGSSRLPPSKDNDYSCNLQTDKTSHHIIIIYKSHYYWFDVLDVNNNPIFQKPEDLEWNLFSIIMDYETNPNTSLPFGVFTTENRKVWSNIRNYIFNEEDKTNYQNLKLIDSALFVICLDDIEFDSTNENELVKSMLCGTSKIGFTNKTDAGSNEDKMEQTLGVQTGTCLNRWYDKLQVIVTKNGKAGINFEHTGVDGHTVLRLATDIYTDSILSYTSTITENTPKIFSNDIGRSSMDNGEEAKTANVITIPRKLEWKMDSFLSSSLHFAETRLSDLISQYEMVTLDFDKYGSSHIKSNFKCSPDAFTQQIFQIAYYSLYGKFENTYEPAMTKTFQNGRTEAIRSVTLESKNFVKSLFDKDATDEDCINFLHEACKKHSHITKECSIGLGQDRHLYALYCIYKERFEDTLPIPIIFRDKSWKILNKNILSTSNCGNPCLKNFGFGPVTPNGFGIGYVIRDESISIVVSSKHRQTQRFVSLIERAFLEVDHIFQRQYPSNDNSISHTNSKNEKNFNSLGSLHRPRKKQHPKSEDLTYLLGGYDYFDVSVTG
ncbi:hypothetical protein Kpol_1045p53 [Vanderwaltozyma polyspora DSM 70294]|uniref:Choline/carnitine acyltransferase domain-containing protein n=1 Tax=Vanderwaltozyma polyspora (strain ATCC 22028 / DSM 70294 / BCRC 21397 / CBS 2163 / NBRC 10782 / NRRL Y-8283 / UCD 57-17) TaxID=436907 RepID=A7TI59_VANPO|nr:uncharacterized protein Kpol_1045p53 [Vanderwaltozyma polyspora DSM 70294]EDO18066.1 hypothetical protein Kpol_1045p53 [Vanderwaltozyma polyspora DSM 70294]